MIGDRPCYGQVAAYECESITICQGPQSTQAAVVDIEEVAPVIFFLLAQAKLVRRMSTREAIVQAHATILARLLGTATHPGTCDIRRLLTGIATVASHPSPTAQLDWLDPRSGRKITCSVRHVVNFGYYTDDNQVVPEGIRVVGQFWEDPLAIVPRAPSRRQERLAFASRLPATPPAQRDNEAPSPPLTTAAGASEAAPLRFVEFMDALEGSSFENHSRPEDSRQANTRAAREDNGLDPVGVPSNTATASMRILAALAEEPDLLQHYARQIGGIERERKRPRYSSISDLIPQVDESTSRSDRHHSFRPSVRQQDIHSLTCADDHRGKSPGSFVDYARASRATRFLPHPATLSRLKDFLFGVCGLSVLYFQRFDLSSQLDYANSSQLNARNFSAGVDLPPVPRDPSHSDLKAALGVLGTYSDEFFDPHTRRLVSAAKNFAEELSDYEPWSSTEVKTLAFWFSNVFAAFRLACEHDLDHKTLTRLDVRSRLSMQDPELSGLLLKMSRQRTRNHHYGHSTSDSNRTSVLATGQPARELKAPSREPTKRSVSKDVGLATPRQGGKQLCLRFVSARGCPSSSPDRCTHSFLGHFTPTVTLDPKVKAHIDENLGGLRADLLHL